VNKQLNEVKENTKKEINKIRKITQDIKKETNKDMET
jgi:hypothetical protein